MDGEQNVCLQWPFRFSILAFKSPLRLSHCFGDCLKDFWVNDEAFLAAPQGDIESSVLLPSVSEERANWGCANGTLVSSFDHLERWAHVQDCLGSSVDILHLPVLKECEVED